LTTKPGHDTYKMRTLIFGMGNLLRSDDGVGLHVIEALGKESLGDNVDLKEGLSGLDILDAVRGYERIILVDAIKSGGRPGTVYKLLPEDFLNVQTVHSFSTHLNMDFPSMLELGKALSPEKMPEDVIIVAIEAEDTTTISDKCTPEVEKGIVRAVELIRRLV
jgi:hydrogenase maturation protease